MLGWRVAISAVLIPLLIGLFWLDAAAGDRAPYLLALCLVLVNRASTEMADLLALREIHVSRYAVCLLGSLLIFAAWYPHLGTAALATSAPETVTPQQALTPIVVALIAALLLLFLATAFRFEKPGSSMSTLGGELLTVCYVGLLLAVTAQLRWTAGSDAGYFVLGSLVVCVKSGDIGAYTLGRLFGKRKLAPTLSPGKTWMGFVGALLFASLAALLWFHFSRPLFDIATPKPAWPWIVLYGVIIGLVGLIGDLCESLIKRDVQAKDSANLLPGFGGLLDLLDSILYAGPVAYLLWNVLPLR